jgi:hypothetical protein
MINENILKIREQIASACSRANRDSAEITVVAVSKNRLPQQIKEVIEAGIYDIGENRVQEALLKYNSVLGTPYTVRTNWHMVGHLQTNKVKEAVKFFACIQSVDSLRLAKEIDAQAAKIGKIQDIMLEVKTSPEATKFGLRPQEVLGASEEFARSRNLRVLGLMTIAPLLDDPEQARPYFRKLRGLRDEIDRLSVFGYRLSVLSMGMTDDFEVAIEEGSTMVRLGRAIFEG